jgi:hypothetical protein
LYNKNYDVAEIFNDGLVYYCLTCDYSISVQSISIQDFVLNQDISLLRQKYDVIVGSVSVYKTDYK